MLSARAAIFIALAGVVPGVALWASGAHIGTVPDTALFGLAIVSSAFLLAWAAEASETEIAQGLAVAFVALIAVLPEYAVSMSFAWKAGQDPAYAPFAVANMTGANRLLIGAAWPLIFFLFWLKNRGHILRLERSYSIDVIALGMATLWSFTLMARGSITLIDTVIFAAIFVGYVSIIMRAPSEEPELLGPARVIGGMRRGPRRWAITGLFLVSAVSILACAEPFAEGLIHSGTTLGIDEFTLVQWLAPFASEAPEFLVASILAWRGRAGVAMGALLSSKVNQWTLLIGGLPLVYAISSGSLHPLPLDSREVEELYLTAAQSAFAVAVLVSLSLAGREAVLLLAVFAVQFVLSAVEVPLPFTVLGESTLTSSDVRWTAGTIYLVMAVYTLAKERGEIMHLLRSARKTARDPGAAHEEDAELHSPVA
ncbi:MAG: sodium:calcium antiporter [Dehalococcoidia bacterium]|nr:MAG: sodium:calcium antiporter [Dehalococcoidia bacterium]